VFCRDAVSVNRILSKHIGLSLDSDVDLVVAMRVIDQGYAASATG
jgi:hypothetical protein